MRHPRLDAPHNRARPLVGNIIVKENKHLVYRPRGIQRSDRARGLRRLTSTDHFRCMHVAVRASQPPQPECKRHRNILC